MRAHAVWGMRCGGMRCGGMRCGVCDAGACGVGYVIWAHAMRPYGCWDGGFLLQLGIMKLVTFRDASGVYVGAIKGDRVIALDAVAGDMLSLIDQGDAGLAKARAIVEAAQGGVALSAVKLLAPIPRPRQNVMCVGMNYVAHAIESDRARGREPKLPEFPVFFSKAPNAVCGHDDDFELDSKVTTQLDYEVEIAFVMGRTGKNISKADALSHVFGYTVVNDISARDLQFRHQQFFKGKSLDGSCPVGPCIVTSDEIPDPGVLGLRLRLNGVTMQDSSVSDLIFNIPTLIESLSLGMTIEAGTIVSTGTPSGVGIGKTPQQFMKDGDVMEAEIDRIGVLRTRVVAV